MREIIEPIFPVFVVLITLIALSGIVVIVLSVFKAWAKHFYNIGYMDGMKAQAYHEELLRDEEYYDKEPCEDCISRKDAINKLKECENLFTSLGVYPWNLIENLPSVKPICHCEAEKRGGDK